MELLLVRHAIAYERDGRRWSDDQQRPLSPRGVERARRAAAGLKRLGVRPTQVFASPLVRTQQTAAILTEFAAWPKACACPQLRPGIPAAAVLAFLARVRAPSIAAVGHEPDLSELLRLCLGGNARSGSIGFKKMGVALLEFRGAARHERGRLAWFAPPKLLRAIR